MEEIMQSNSFFIIPLTLSYTAICGLWFILNKAGKDWSIEPIEPSKKPWLDLVIGVLTSVIILLIGQIYSAGFLIPKTENVLVNQIIIWPLNNVIIFSPIFIVLKTRQQSLKTVFLSKGDIFYKLGFGFIASLVGIAIFIGLRGEWSRTEEIFTRAIQLNSLSNFPAVFFENVALAFLFVRLKWAIGIRWAIGIPAVLFSLAHVPGSIMEGDPIGHIIIFFILTGSLTTVILYTAYRSRDIVWLGIVHYLMDVVIKAF